VKIAGSAARKTDDAGATPDARKVSSMTLAATVPVGAGFAKAAFGRITPDGDNNDTSKWAIGYEHFLSKRTSLKGSYASSKTENLTRTNGYEAGIVHRF
jgi:predicted porin